MESISAYLIEFVRTEDSLLGLATLAASAALEYLFPPFPGDAVTLFGAVLITAFGWSFPAVFGAVMLGSSVGAMAAFALGVYLARKRPETPPSQRTIVNSLVEKFARHGAWYLVLNRFVPGVRALFFVAAGLARMRPLEVFLYSALSAALWNGGLIAVGAAVGANLDDLTRAVRTYQIVAWIVVGVVAIFLIYRMTRRHANTDALETDAAEVGSASADAANPTDPPPAAGGLQATGAPRAGAPRAGASESPTHERSET